MDYGGYVLDKGDDAQFLKNAPSHPTEDIIGFIENLPMKRERESDAYRVTTISKDEEGWTCWKTRTIHRATHST